MICPVCHGAGFVEIGKRKIVVKPEKDPWDIFNGQKIRQHICKKCRGRGEI